jgi:hypothetical protein
VTPEVDAVDTPVAEVPEQQPAEDSPPGEQSGDEKGEGENS